MMTVPPELRALDIQWLGTAGFALRSGETTILIDPYFTRNEKSRPVQPLTPEDFREVTAILISHGHFDHLADVPEIVQKSKATVYCSEVAGKTLMRAGVAAEHISVLGAKTAFSIAGFSVTASPSKHVFFDFPLIWRTLVQARFNLLKYRHLLTDWPKGNVFSYRLEVEGLGLHHFGSAGSTDQELRALDRRPLDILMVPLQGNTHICRIGANITKALKPKMVIPHHYDDFYPPISSMVDIQPFVDEIEKDCPSIIVKQLSLNQVWKVELGD